MSTSVISSSSTSVCVINLFTVREGHTATEVVDVVRSVTEDVMRTRPGFISANVHVSLDGLTVVNYSQWESEEAVRGMLSDPAARVHMARTAEVGDSLASIYHVELVMGPSGE